MKSNLAGIIVAFSLVAPTFCQAQIILSHLRRRADFFSTGSLLSNRLTPLFSGGPLVATAADPITNGGFEDNPDFHGWSTSGDSEIFTGSGSGIAPDSGNKYAFMSTVSSGGAVTASAIESFLGLTAGTLAAQGGTPTGEGSAIKQTISIGAADVGKFLTVRWNFTTDLVIQTGENDYGFLTINGNANFFKLADMHDSRLHDSTFFVQAFPSETGWQSFSFRVDTAGSYTLGLGVMDIGASPDSVDSALLADTVALSAVPEPWQWSLVSALGLCGFALARRVRSLRPVAINRE